VDYLRRELAGRLDEESWLQSSVETTLDLDLQEAANQAVSTTLSKSVFMS
jgi:membrane carboxypeptidase/penicillin-binding protein